MTGRVAADAFDPRTALRAFMERGEGDFESLALALYRWQLAHNPQYAAFAGGAQVERWEDLPAVPVALFRDLSFTSFPLERARVVFRTSGTTAGRRGAKHLEDTVLYDLGARLHAEACMGPLPRLGLSLVPTAADSSLGHMCAAFVPGMPSFFSSEGGVDAGGAWAALAERSGGTEPVFVPGTAFAFDVLVAEAPGPVRLPEGSQVMVTGGFKGRHTDLDEAGLIEALGELLPGTRLVGEYGMTELSSQLWAVPAGGPYTPPPWMRVLAVDPGTGAPVREGQLRFVDLANHQTVLAIETMDLGEVLEDGRVVLRGRLPRAELRGCSLTVEEAGS